MKEMLNNLINDLKNRDLSNIVINIDNEVCYFLEPESFNENKELFLNELILFLEKLNEKI